jgi:hypothetical protein
MKQFLKEFIFEILLLNEAKTKGPEHPPGVWQATFKSGKKGKWYAKSNAGKQHDFSSREAAQKWLDRQNANDSGVTPAKDNDTTPKVKGKPGRKSKPKPDTAIKTSDDDIKQMSVELRKSLGSLPGGLGLLDAFVGKADVGSAGAGTVQSKAAEATVVAACHHLLSTRGDFQGDIKEFLSQNNELIDQIIDTVRSLPKSKLKDNWVGPVKGQIVTTLAKVEEEYGTIQSIVWDNAEGRKSIGLPAAKQRDDRSDLYIVTETGEIIGVSLKKNGSVFLANQGYKKTMGIIAEFAKDEKTKGILQRLSKLHKDLSDKAYKSLKSYVSTDTKEVNKALSSFNRTGIKSLSSDKYDKFFNPDGTLTKQFLLNVALFKSKSNEDKCLLKALTGVSKSNADIKKHIDDIREVDVIATRQFINELELNTGVRETTTRYLLDALDIPQMLGIAEVSGVSHVATVYGEGNVDDSGKGIPMFVNGKTLQETFGLSDTLSKEETEAEISKRFMIDAESDKKVGMIRLRITNMNPPPAHYYPSMATMAIRARGLNTAGIFELYQHDAWTFTLASHSPDPREWTTNQRTKHAKSTVKFLTAQLNNDSLSKEERAALQGDIEFYSSIK